jgi:Ni,Fe-hydrogenase I large subunit
MEMTMEQKQRKYEKETEWRENNPDKIKEYNKRSYEKNKEKQSLYYREYYYPNHREIMLERGRKWRELNDKLDCVYLMKNNKFENIYIGSTTHKARFSAHLTGNSNLKMDAEELVNNYNLSSIIYQCFDEYDLNRHDLYWIEKFYKDTQGEIFKGNSVPCDLSKLSRSEDELFEIINNVEFIEFCKLDKYLN